MSRSLVADQYRIDPAYDVRPEKSRVDDADQEMQVPFFITGCPRSGTTLLQVMLNRHPMICIPPELKLFFTCHKMPRWIRQQTIDRVRQDLGIDLARHRHAVTSTEAIYRGIWEELNSRTDRPEHLAFSAPPGEAEGVSEMCTIDEQAEKRGQFILGDKTPEYAYRLRWINDVFPEAKIVLMVRDARDVAFSLAKAPWLHCGLTGAAALWNRTQRQLRKEAAGYGDRVHWVRYESLVADPESVLEPLLEFLGVPCTALELDTMLCLSSKDVDTVPERELSWKGCALKQLTRSRSGAWKDRSEAEIRQIESQCYEQLCLAGYDPCCPRDPATLWTRVHGALATAKMVSRLPFRCWVSEGLYRWDATV